MDSPNPLDTYERLLELLELLYRMIRQPMPELVAATPEGWFSVITVQYIVFGVPASLTAAEREQGRAWIVEIKASMQAVPQLLNPLAAAFFSHILDQIYADLGD